MNYNNWIIKIENNHSGAKAIIYNILSMKNSRNENIYFFEKLISLDIIGYKLWHIFRVYCNYNLNILFNADLEILAVVS